MEKLEKIFRTGGLKNGVALAEDDSGMTAFDLNSGFEGISWSMDKIDALPGTRGHIAGFVAAPEDILAEDEQLVVPSRPAPYEVLQIDGEIDAQELYSLKTQCETWGDGGVSVGEKNNVDSNLMRMIMYQEDDKLFDNSTVYQYDGDTSAEEMQKYYKIGEGNAVTWDEDLQQKSEIPPALPWFQTLIDRGIFERNNVKGLDNVESVVNRTREDKDFLKILLATARKEAKPYLEKYNKTLDNASAVRIKPEEMYFVTSHQDLDNWLKVMVRNNVQPKGILLYDDDQVAMENFASVYEGNHRELSEEIGRAVGIDEDFWRDEMGMDVENMPRSGRRGQVLLESAVKRDKTLKMVDGELKVV